MRYGVIYKVSLGNNFIIGSTLNPNKRSNDYKSILNNGGWRNQYVQNSYNKYGKESFKFEIFQENIPEDILLHVEDIWIGALCSRIEDNRGGMNMRDANNINHSQETKDKISKANKGKKRTEDCKKNMSKKRLGKKLSQLTKEKISKKNSRKVYQYDLQGNFIKEWKSSIEAANYIKGNDSNIHACCSKRKYTYKGYMWFKEFNGDIVNPYIKSTPYNLKKVNQYSLKGEFIKQWDSISEAAQSLGLKSIGNITMVCNNKRKSTGGFKWKYADQPKIKKK